MLVVVAIALLGTTLLSSTANGIAIFMVFGAGLAAGLIGQIGSALDSSALERISSIASWALPFEAVYQDGLHALTADVRGATGVIVQLGPFGGAQDAGPLLYPYVARVPRRGRARRQPASSRRRIRSALAPLSSSRSERSPTVIGTGDLRATSHVWERRDRLRTPFVAGRGRTPTRRPLAGRRGRR